MSCTDFFSTSLAPWAARDPNKLIPAVTTGNVKDLITQAENDPDLSLAILKKIQSAANGASGQDLQTLQNASLEAAVNAAGLGQAVLGTASNLSKIDFSAEETTAADVQDIILKAVGSLSNLDSTGQALLAILPDPKDTETFNAWAENAPADDLAMAAVVLIAGEINKQNFTDSYGIDDYLSDLDPTLQNPEQTDNENMAMALALATAIGDRDDISGPLKNVLDGLKLWYPST